jgi:hypothetical protein
MDFLHTLLANSSAPGVVLHDLSGPLARLTKPASAKFSMGPGAMAAVAWWAPSSHRREPVKTSGHGHHRSGKAELTLPLRSRAMAIKKMVPSVESQKEPELCGAQSG